jgi:Oxidoreductase family, NAD-binding Rossmann fold
VSATGDRRRVGVIGAGLISQAMHLPHLALLRDRFELAVVADPSRTVRERVGDRFGIPRRVATASEAIAEPGLHAVVIGTPNATHAPIVLEALAAGLDVFVEKPLAITLEDVDAIVEAQRSSERVVQVGYNNRFDRSYARLVEELPDSVEGLRYLSVLMHDPEFGPYFGAEDLARGSDIPAEIIEQARADEAAQVKQAVGADDAESVAAFSGGFLGSLIHQVNMVHGMLERMGEPLPAEVTGGDAWAGGQALAGSVRLSNGARWDSAWIQLLDMHEYEESIRLYFADSVRTLAIPSPWLRQAPSVYSLTTAGDGGRRTARFESYEEAYQLELVHFHRCMLGAEECRTPPTQARVDQEVLTEMFRRRERPASG